MSTQSGQTNDSPTNYNNVHPFDSKSLQKLIAENAVNGDDFKFISWNDFDAALESDAMLFEKLVSLSNLDAAGHDNVEPNFVPFGNYKSNDYFYRINRGAGDLHKEKISYQE